MQFLHNCAIVTLFKKPTATGQHHEVGPQCKLGMYCKYFAVVKQFRTVPLLSSCLQSISS